VREKCFIVKPRSFSDLDLPTDLLGITPADYDDEREDDNIVAAVGPCANKIRRSLIPRKKAKTKTPKSIQGILTSQPFRLFFNPRSKGSKRIVFKPKGLIVEGNNKNEHRWRISQRKLEIIQLDGKVHSRFNYNKEERIFQHTNDPDTLSIRDQFMVPDVPGADV